jgi:hypothetical protein
VRIPLWKAYRAFPELDRFTDAECVEWVALAKSTHRAFLGMVGVVVVVVLIPLTIAVIVLVSRITNAIAASPAMASAWRSMRMTKDDVETMFIGLNLMVVLTLAYVAGASVADLALRHVLRKRLNSGRCPGCEYSLLGLPARDDVVLCPECGASLNLAELGLTPADILAGKGGKWK